MYLKLLYQSPYLLSITILICSTTSTLKIMIQFILNCVLVVTGITVQTDETRKLSLLFFLLIFTIICKNCDFVAYSLKYF